MIVACIGFFCCYSKKESPLLKRPVANYMHTFVQYYMPSCEAHYIHIIQYNTLARDVSS